MPPRPSFPRPSCLPTRGALAAAAVLASLAATGCVERKMVLRSDPAGALVSLEDAPAGAPTPVEVPFSFDGVRRVTLTAPGHEVLQTHAELETRWYDYFPLDFVAEFLWPWTIEDVQEFDYRLEPFAVGLDRQFTDEERAALRQRLDDLTARAEEYRRGGTAGPDEGQETSEDVSATPGPASEAAPGPAPPPAKAGSLPDIPSRRPPPRQSREVPAPTPPGHPLPPPVRPQPLVPPKEPEQK